MKSCKHKIRLQIYLDGWMEDSEAARFEKHLKKCSICQSEIMELEDISAAALEIVDEAPERGYWDSFYPRTLNRIISRNITPYESSEVSRKGLRLKIGTYSLEIVSLAAIILLTVNFLPDILNLMAEKSSDRGIAVEQVEPVLIVEATDNAQAVGPLLPGGADPITLEESTEPVSSDRQATELVLVESGRAEESADALVAETEVLDYFNDEIVTEKPELLLSDLTDFSREPAKTEFANINKDYRLSSSMIAAGILSELNNKKDDAGSLNGKIEFSVAGNGFNNFLNGASGSWGYLSMPTDSGNTEEFRRYLIELELIQTK